MNAKNRSAALARLQPHPGSPSLLAAATGPYAGEGFATSRLKLKCTCSPSHS